VQRKPFAIIIQPRMAYATDAEDPFSDADWAFLLSEEL
jgi:hypothetical protein